MLLKSIICGWHCTTDLHAFIKHKQYIKHYYWMLLENISIIRGTVNKTIFMRRNSTFLQPCI